MGESDITKRLIADGLSRPSPAPLTDAEALAERCEAAALPGADTSERKRALLQAAAFIRQHHGRRRVA